MLTDPSTLRARAPRTVAAPVDRRTRVWRLALFGPAAATALGFAALPLAAYGFPDGPLSAAVMLAFWLVASWHGLIAWQYALGYVAARAGEWAQSEFERRAALVPAAASGLTRTAAIVPIHAEDPAAVFAALRAMALSLARAGGKGRDIDFFVLSDTQDPAVADAEERELAAFQAWRRAGPAGLPAVRYRRRTENAGRKAGNVAEFCRTYGPDYDFMIVLDADSLMGGPAMRRLVRLMEASPEVGLIQTVSYATGRDTLFARIQQFAVRLYAPLAIRSLDAWQGADGGYWGHNAILRIAAFAANAALPVLPGRPPLGGEILCHDTVEGALMRRAGWEVRLLPELPGTWEEMPTNIVDLLGRERRWCQGNLQHLKVLPWPGLRFGSRLHLLTGILGYAMAPVWIAFLALGTTAALRTGDLGLLAYGLTGSGPAAAALAALTLAVFGAPKVLSLAHVLADRRLRRSFGGAGRLLASVLLEQLLWVALWPVLTLFNAGAVVTTLAGRVVRWDAQARTERGVPLREALRLQADAVGVGLALLVALVLARDPALWLWMGPVALALVLAPALSAWTSRVDLGRRSRALGLFLTVDDCDTAPELRDLARLRAEASRGDGQWAPVPPPRAEPRTRWLEEAEVPASR